MTGWGNKIKLQVRIYNPELFKSIKSGSVQLNISSYYILHLLRVKIGYAIINTKSIDTNIFLEINKNKLMGTNIFGNSNFR